MKIKLLTALAGAAGIAWIQVASAADMPVKAPVRAAAAVVATNWSGMYVGAHVGYGWSDVEWTYDGFSSPNNLFDGGGLIAGGQVGWNYQTGMWIWGIEGEASWARIRDTVLNSPNPTYNAFVDINWLATITGRLGYAFDRALLYAKGGVAFAEIERGLDQIGTTTIARGSATRTGWIVGGGLEYAVAPGWSAKIEYNYIDLGSFNNTETYNVGGTDDATIKAVVHTVKTGLNFRFVAR